MEFEAGKKYKCVQWVGKFFTVGETYSCEVVGKLKNNDGGHVYPTDFDLDSKFEEVRETRSKDKWEVGEYVKVIHPYSAQPLLKNAVVKIIEVRYTGESLDVEDTKGNKMHCWHFSRFEKLKPLTEVPPKGSKIVKIKKGGECCYDDRLGEVFESGGIAHEDKGNMWVFNNGFKKWTNLIGDWALVEAAPVEKVVENPVKDYYVDHLWGKKYYLTKGESYYLKRDGIPSNSLDPAKDYFSTRKEAQEFLDNYNNPRTVGVRFGEYGKTYHYFSKTANVGDKLEIINHRGNQVVTVVEVGNNKLATKEAGKVLNNAEVMGIAGERKCRETLRENTFEKGDWVEALEVGPYDGEKLVVGNKYQVTELGEGDTKTICLEGKEFSYRESRFKKTTAPLEDGWIAWSGGKCPLNSGDHALIRFKRGTNFDSPGDGDLWQHSNNVDWEHTKGDEAFMVTAYKPLNPPVQDGGVKETRQFCYKDLDIDELLAKCEELNESLAATMVRATEAETKLAESQTKYNDQQNQQFTAAFSKPYGEIGSGIEEALKEYATKDAVSATALHKEKQKKPSFFSKAFWI